MKMQLNILALILCCTQLWAVIDMNAEKVLQFSAAQSGITRISVESDKIVETFIDPVDVTTSIKNNRGHIYLSGQKNIAHLYLSIITKTGQVQDIKINFKDMQPKPILLRKPQQMTAPHIEGDLAEEYLKWLRVFLKGNAPQSFEPKPLSNLAATRQSGNFLASPISAWVHEQGYTVTQYRISISGNDSSPVNELRAEQFQNLGDLALVCSARAFCKDKEIYLFVLRKEVIH